MTAGDIYTVAGGGTSTRDGALATAALLTQPHAVAVDSAGNIAIAARHSRLLRVVAARGGTFYGVRMRARHLYVIAGNGQGWSSGGGGLAVRAQFFPSHAVTFDSGNLAVASCRRPANCASMTVRLVPARSGTFFGQAMTAGHLYRIAGNGQAAFSGMGGPARKAGLDFVSALAADAHGNLVIADEGNNRILVLAARAGRFYGRSMQAGHIYLIAGNGGGSVNTGNGGPARKARVIPNAVCVDQDGNIVIGSGVKVRVVAERAGTFDGIKMTAGDIYNVAGSLRGIRGDGGPARDARFEGIDALVPVGSRGLLISDPYRIRMIATTTGTFFGVPMTAGDIYTVADTAGNPGPSPDGTPALAADIWPHSLALDSAGNLIFYDVSVNKIRVIPARTGTFYGVPMTARHLYSIVGGGTGGLGDGGPGTQATIAGPFVALAAHRHRLAFIDGGDLRVRMIVR
jgi:hypothetical protein